MLAERVGLAIVFAVRVDDQVLHGLTVFHFVILADPLAVCLLLWLADDIRVAVALYDGDTLHIVHLKRVALGNDVKQRVCLTQRHGIAYALRDALHERLAERLAERLGERIGKRVAVTVGLGLSVCFAVLLGLVTAVALPHGVADFLRYAAHLRRR
jgi:hypothetical protein